MDPNKNLAKALGVDFEEKEKKEIVKKKPTEIKVDHKDIQDPDLKKDYLATRKNLMDLIDNGKDAIQGIMNVAEEGEHPRAYEVVAQLIKTVADVNKDLIDIHKKVKDVEVTKVENNETTNNSIFIGSTSELQNLINANRSTKKIVSEIVDEPKDDG
jgi:hypothetical protein